MIGDSSSPTHPTRGRLHVARCASSGGYGARASPGTRNRHAVITLRKRRSAFEHVVVGLTTDYKCPTQTFAMVPTNATVPSTPMHASAPDASGASAVNELVEFTEPKLSQST